MKNCVREEFQKGNENLPDPSHHLIDYDMEEALNFPSSKKKIWFNSMEAKIGRVPMIYNKERDANTDIRFADYEPDHEGICKWIATG